jgi:hypothetical protein
LQCANKPSFCPIFKGDTRITALFVDRPRQDIPKQILLSELEKEASAFLDTILTVELPKPEGRLTIPVIENEQKMNIQDVYRSALEEFFEERVHHIDGDIIAFSEFYNEFLSWLDPTERHEWSKRKVSQELPLDVIKGRYGTACQMGLGNISFDRERKAGAKVLKAGDRLV